MRTLNRCVPSIILLFALPLYAGEKILTIIQPTSAFSPDGFPPDSTLPRIKRRDGRHLGGWARVATSSSAKRPPAQPVAGARRR
jgi:hypothetical protein